MIRSSPTHGAQPPCPLPSSATMAARSSFASTAGMISSASSRCSQSRRASPRCTQSATRSWPRYLLPGFALVAPAWPARLSTSAQTSCSSHIHLPSAAGWPLAPGQAPPRNRVDPPDATHERASVASGARQRRTDGAEEPLDGASRPPSSSSPVLNPARLKPQAAPHTSAASCADPGCVAGVELLRAADGVCHQIVCSHEHLRQRPLAESGEVRHSQRPGDVVPCGTAVAHV